MLTIWHGGHDLDIPLELVGDHIADACAHTLDMSVGGRTTQVEGIPLATVVTALQLLDTAGSVVLMTAPASPTAHHSPLKIVTLRRSEAHPEVTARLEAAWKSWQRRAFVDEWTGPDHTNWGHDIRPAPVTKGTAPQTKGGASASPEKNKDCKAQPAKAP